MRPFQIGHSVTIGTIMFPTERVLELLSVVVLIFLVPAGLLFFLCKTVWKGSLGKVMQVFSIVISQASSDLHKSEIPTLRPLFRQLVDCWDSWSFTS